MKNTTVTMPLNEYLELEKSIRNEIMNNLKTDFSNDAKIEIYKEKEKELNTWLQRTREEYPFISYEYEIQVDLDYKMKDFK